MALKYTYDITNMTATIWDSITATAKQAYIKKFVDDLIKNEGTNADFWISSGFPQGAVITKIAHRGGGFDICFFYNNSASKISVFDIRSYSYGAPVLLKCLVPLKYDEFAYSFTTPIKSIEIPKPEIEIKTYLQFMQKSSLYNSLVTGVQSTIATKPTVQALSDYILNIMQNFTDGMVIFDYYQWQGESINGMTELRMYKNFYLRVFGKVGTQLVCKSIPIDYHLFEGIAGASILDNGIQIAGNGEVVGNNTYIRYGYMIHGNNCDLQSLIDKIQEDNNFTTLPLEFADLDSISEKLSDNKDFLTKDGKSAQDRYNEYYNNALSKYSQLKSVLGLTDEQVASMSKQEAERLMQNYINTYNNTAQLELATQNAQIEKQNAQQAQADSTAKQQEKEDAKAEKAKQAALLAEKNKQSNEQYFKKAYQSYAAAIAKLNKFTGSSRAIPTYAQFSTAFSSLGTTNDFSFIESSSMTVPLALDSHTGKYYNGYKWNYKLVLKDSDKDGVIDSMSVVPLVISVRYCDDTGANALGDNILLSDDDNVKAGSSVNTEEDLSNLTTPQNTNTDSGTYAALVAGMYELGGLITKPLSAFLTSYDEVGATEHQDMQNFISTHKELYETIKAKADNDKLIPQYLETISNKNMSPDVNVSGLNIDLTPLNQRLEAMTLVHQNHYDEYKIRENKRVEREEIAHTDWHGKETEESITLGGVRKNGAPVVLDMPQGYFGRLKKSGFYQKQAEQLYDVESDNQAGNGMSIVKGSGQSTFKIDTTKEIKHITGEDYEIAKEFGEFENISKVAEGYQATVQKWIDDSWVDGEYSPE